MPTVRLRFYGPLNDFLLPGPRQRERSCCGSTSGACSSDCRPALFWAGSHHDHLLRLFERALSQPIAARSC
jgi:hypothetical protein